MNKKYISKGNLIKCISCEEYFNESEAFYCPKCKKGPLCGKHRVIGRKECLSCNFDNNIRELGILKKEEENLRSFMSFLKFIFIIAFVFLVSSRVGFIEEIDFLKDNFIIKNMVYVVIGFSVLLAFFYYLKINQKKKIEKINLELEKMRHNH